MNTDELLREAGKAEARFWEKVGPRIKGECWLWKSTVGGRYGQFWFCGRKWKANRFSWMLANQRNPGSLHVCHTCDVPLCVNPDHLWLGTASDNISDAVSKGRVIPPSLSGRKNHNGRKTHCPRGHPYSGENLYVTSKGRFCRECHRIQDRRKSARRKKQKAQL